MIGGLIKKYREDELKMDIKEFANHIGKPVSTVYRWESGKQFPYKHLALLKEKCPNLL